MANKLDRIEKDIEKTKAKIAELQKQLRELEAADRAGEFADHPACARPEYEAGGICGVPARRRFAERPGPAAGFCTGGQCR